MSKTGELFDYIHACLPNVTGVGHAYKVTQGKQTDKFGLTISVKKKLPKYMLNKKELIPPEIEGEVTDVIEGEFRALHLLTKKMPEIMEGGEGRTDKWRPAPGGVSVGHPDITAGTLGGWLYHGTDVVMLSNNHVLANQNDAEIGDDIYQPGVYDGGTIEDKIAELVSWVEINFSGGDNVCDCAIAKPDNLDDVDWQTLGITTGAIKYKVAPTLGMSVTKSGRTTEVTQGQISSIDWSGNIGYGGGKVAKYVDQIYIGNVNFIGGGDSGSWLLQEKEGATPDTIVGLCFAGDATGQAIANPITPVFEELGLGLALPATLEGYVYLGDGVIAGAYVLCYNPISEEFFVDITDSNGKYSFPDVGYLNETVLISAHYANDEVYQAGCYKKIQSDPETLDLTLEEYDAVADGKEVNFIFTGGGSWEQLDLYLEQYKSVWN